MSELVGFYQVNRSPALSADGLSNRSKKASSTGETLEQMLLSEPSALEAGIRGAVEQRLSRAVKALLATVTAPEVLIDALAEPFDLDVLRRLMGALETSDPGAPALSHEAALATLPQMSFATREALLAAEGGCDSAAEVAGLLGISVQAVHKRANKHQLLSFPGKGGRDGDRFPKCQFVDGAVLKGIPQVVAGMASHGPEVTLSFLISPSPRLEGDARPIDLLRAGKVAEVLRAVERYGEHGG